jgi:hypothetical protein
LTEIQWLTVGWLVGAESNKSNNNIDEILITDNLGWVALLRRRAARTVNYGIGLTLGNETADGMHW